MIEAPAYNMFQPTYQSSSLDWDKWRLTYGGGEPFRTRYLQQYTGREDINDFEVRRAITPIPSFAKAALNEIRNAIFQRMRDIIRTGGSPAYQQSVTGLKGGVDRRGSSMNSFLGMKILTDLLVMGQVGVYVDNTASIGPRMVDTLGATPYLYDYKLENIISYTRNRPDKPSEFQALLLKDFALSYDGVTGLPTGESVRYRRLWIDDITGRVMVQFYGADQKEDGDPVELGLTRIPFVLLDIGDSLLEDVADFQIALLNLTSSDVSYALKANFPFLVKQDDGRGASHLKSSETEDGTATAGGQGAGDRDVRVGTIHGLTYAAKLNQPAFINPSSEPLRVSMELQQQFKNDIRELVNLAVANLSSRASAESKSLDNQGLEAGLSYIGLVLENAERQIAEYFAAYENSKDLPTIKYPDRYSLKTDADRIEESTKLATVVGNVPSRKAKQEIAKLIVRSLLGGKVSVEVVDEINKQVDDAPYTSSDPVMIGMALDKGACGEQTASIALGFKDDEYKVAQVDHAARIARIAAAQTPAGDPAARGVPDLSGNPGAGSQEKKVASDVTLQNSVEQPVRGKGK
jgi:hypothetical protein